MAASKVENGEVDDEELEDKAAGGSCSNSNRQEEPQTDLLTNPHLLTKKKALVSDRPWYKVCAPTLASHTFFHVVNKGENAVKQSLDAGQKGADADAGVVILCSP